MTRIRIIQKFDDKVITVSQAKEAMKVSERTIFRYLSDFRNLWPPGLIHGLKWKPSNNQIGKLQKDKKYAMKEIPTPQPATTAVVRANFRALHHFVAIAMPILPQVKNAMTATQKTMISVRQIQKQGGCACPPTAGTVLRKISKKSVTTRAHHLFVAPNATNMCDSQREANIAALSYITEPSNVGGKTTTANSDWAIPSNEEAK